MQTPSRLAIRSLLAFLLAAALLVAGCSKSSSSNESLPDAAPLLKQSAAITLSPDAVIKIAPQIAAAGPVPGSAWIQEDGNLQLMQAKIDPSSGNSITMTMSDWGKPVTVTKPAV